MLVTMYPHAMGAYWMDITKQESRNRNYHTVNLLSNASDHLVKLQTYVPLPYSYHNNTEVFLHI